MQRVGSFWGGTLQGLATDLQDLGISTSMLEDNLLVPVADSFHTETRASSA